MTEFELPRDIAQDGPEHRIELLGGVSIPRQYARALARARMPQGAMSGPARQALGPIVVEQPRRALDPAWVARYREVCGYGPGEAVPTSFLEILFQGLMVEIVLAPSFPFSPFGVIHISQSMQHHRTIAADAVLDLRCWLERVRQTRRGFELELAMLAELRGEPVWEGVAGLISRGKSTREGKTAAPKAPPADPGGWGEPFALDVAGDTGRRYASVSSDYNPFHLYGFLAKLFGFRRPIAHGMWTLARALAWVEVGLPELPEAHRVQAAFKRPLFMPGAVHLRQRPLADGVQGCAFEVRHAQKDHPHLVGELSW
jgi:acyl dehydratase